jgi:hypothetical protein
MLQHDDYRRQGCTLTNVVPVTGHWQTCQWLFVEIISFEEEA